MVGLDAAKTPRRIAGRARPSASLTWVAVAVVVRLVAAVRYSREPVGFHDPFFYRIAAAPIAEGRGYRSSFGELTAYYPPGYPHVLGSLQWIADTVGRPDALVGIAVVFQALLWGLVTWAAMATAARVWNRRVAVIAGGIVALWPNLILHSTVLLTETVYLALLSGLLLVVVVTAQTAPGGTVRQLLVGSVGAGTLLGSAALVRPQVLLLAPVLAAAPLVNGVDRRRALAVAGVMAVVCVWVIVPWTARNQSVFGEFVAISTNGGDNLCMGFHEGASGTFGYAPACETGEIYTDGPDAEYRRNREAARRARERISANASELPVLSVRKLWHTYRGDTDALRAVESYGEDRFLGSVERSVWRVASTAFYVVVMAATVIGVVRTVRLGKGPRRALRRWLTVVMVVSAAGPLVVFGEQRFKVATAPLFAIVAAAGAAAVGSRSASDVPLASD